MNLEIASLLIGIVLGIALHYRSEIFHYVTNKIRKMRGWDEIPRFKQTT